MKNTHHWTNTVRYRIVLATKRSSQTWTGRGCPRIYGIKITLDVIWNLPATETRPTFYVKEQLVRLRAVMTLARFLKGTPVRAVWCEFYDVDKQR